MANSLIVRSARAAAPPDGVVMEDVACPMGCAQAAIEVARGWDRLHAVPGEFRVVRCGGCGLMRTSPRPSLDTIAAYYPEDTYGPYRGALPVRSTDRMGALLRALRLDGTQHLLPRIPPGVALEVGCAAGHFMQKLRRGGWTMYGIEPSREAARRAIDEGFSVHVGPLETAPDPVAPFDLIVASHSFEHLHDPMAAFRRLRTWSKVGGYLTCAVPDAGGLLFRYFRGAWYDLDLPRHLFHFTAATLGAMLARTGWKVERVRSERTLNSMVGSFGQFLQDRRGGGRSPLGDALVRYCGSGSPLKALNAPWSFLLQALRQTGRMVIWARAVD